MKVQVLTTPGCSNCSVLEKMLEQLGVKYDLIDVTEKPEYLEKISYFYCSRVSHQCKIRVYRNSKN